jgi:hypothetical protein
MPITKNYDLDLDAFLHSATHLPIKALNKHFIFTLGDTNDVIFSLNEILDFDPIIFFKSRVLSCTNRKISYITFKFIAGLNMQLIFNCFYASKKKQRLLNHFDMMCGQDLLFIYNIETIYIDFIFPFILFSLFTIFFFFSFYFLFCYYRIVFIS